MEDLGFLVLESPQISLTQSVLQRCAKGNVVVISCDEKHMPCSLQFPIEGHHLQQIRFQSQINASLPFRKRMWRDTIKAKCQNQANVLKQLGKPDAYIVRLSENVKSGDPDGCEARAARYYWKHLFDDVVADFRRDRDAEGLNSVLNYGYSILRASMARAIVASGMLPTLGIHHRNQYNAFALADDLMEPYRPIVDVLAREMVQEAGEFADFLTPTNKQDILSLLAQGVLVEAQIQPLQNAMLTTAQSFAKCLTDKNEKLHFPKI